MVNSTSPPVFKVSRAGLNHCIIDMEVALLMSLWWKQIMKKNNSPARVLVLGEKFMNAFEAASEPLLGFLAEANSKRTGEERLNCAKRWCLRDPFPYWFIAVIKRMGLLRKGKLMASPPQIYGAEETVQSAVFFLAHTHTYMYTHIGLLLVEMILHTT